MASKDPTSSEILNQLRHIEAQISQLQSQQQKLSQHMKTMQKEQKQFQEDIYHNFTIVDSDLNYLKENVDGVMETVDVVAKKTNTIHKRMRNIRLPVEVMASDSDNNMMMKRSGMRSKPRSAPSQMRLWPKQHSPRKEASGGADFLKSTDNYNIRNESSSEDENIDKNDLDAAPKHAPITSTPVQATTGLDADQTSHLEQTSRKTEPVPQSPVHERPPLEETPSTSSQQVVRREGSLLPEKPQEADFRQLMASFGLETNNHTIGAVTQAGKVGPRSSPKVSGLNTVFILDTSSSLNGQAFAQLKSFMDSFLDEVDNAAADQSLEENIALVTCGESTAIMRQFTNDFAQIRADIEALCVKGKTPLLTAMVLCLSYLELHGESINLHGQYLHPRVILISDGNATSDKTFTGTDTITSTERIQVQSKLIALAGKFKERKYPIFCVSVGAASNQTLLGELASSSGGKLMANDSGPVLGKYYRYQTVVCTALKQYADSVESGEEQEIDDMLLRLMSEASLEEADKPSLDEFLTARLMDDGEEHQADEGGISEEEVEAEVEEEEVEEEDEDKKVEGKGATALVSSEWTVRSELNEVSLEELADLPPIGTRVKRGPHWKWGDQDANGGGTITGHSKIGRVFVSWDNGSTQIYRYGHKGETYDVMIDEEPRRVPPGHIDLGCWVKRGADWNRGDEDGGENTVGTVIRKLPGRKVLVRWPSRVMDEYRYGADGKYDLQITLENPNKTEVNTPVRPSIPGEEAGSMPVWEWMDKSNNWRLFSDDACIKIEAKNGAGQCMVQSRGKNVKIFLSSMEFEFSQTQERGKIRRRMMSEKDKQELQMLEDFLAAN